MDTRKKTLTFPKGSLWGPCTRMLAPCGASHPLFQHPQRSVHATLPSGSQIQPGGILPKKSSRSSKTLSHGFRVAGAHHTSCVFPHSAPAFTCLAIPTGVVCVWDEPGWEAGCYHCSRSACDFFFYVFLLVILSLGYYFTVFFIALFTTGVLWVLVLDIREQASAAAVRRWKQARGAQQKRGFLPLGSAWCSVTSRCLA